MFKFLPIGGVGFIGGNVSYMEIDEFPFLIDTGILFPKEESLGMDHLYPDLEVLDNELLKSPEYLLLTHAHEDHIGGLKYLNKSYPKIKIVCSSYTREFILKKFPNMKLNLLDTKEFNKKFPKFNFFKLRHSIPGVYGFNYQDKEKSILFCTDFRFDLNESDESYLNLDYLKSISDVPKKVALLDSTNIASSSDSSVYEKDLYDNLKNEISSATQDTYITLFPSNTNRLAAIINICNELNRPCCLAGFSVEFSYSLGLSTGLIAPIKDSTFSKGRSIVLLSGSQGDLRGAFRRVFTSNDKKFKPIPGDQLLYSSKVIPGNEKLVGDMFNKASELGLHISKGKDPCIHASGHAYPDEINSIVKTFNPNHVVPIHLESSFFQEFIQKVSNNFSNLTTHRLENYKMLTLDQKFSPKVTDFEKLDLKIYLHGGQVADKSVINNRRRLGNTGTLFISFVKEDSTSMKINYYGLPDINISELKSEVSRIIINEWSSKDLQESVRIATRLYLNKKIGFKPLVFIHIL